MRILLLTPEQSIRNAPALALEARGHEVIHAASGGEGLLTAAEQAGRLHAAVLSQVALGNGWPRLLRQLRRRAPYLPAVVLLGSGSEPLWRLAILAGAFEALPESAATEEILQAVFRALAYSGGKPRPEPSAFHSVAANSRERSPFQSLAAEVAVPATRS